ncbi:MAG TPA: hypothetical protein VH575_29325 [Gemmataceae bacterium]|jgi:hypothetical protein
MSTDDRANSLTGRLHLYVAFDWGDEIDLEHAARLVPAAVLTLARRPRTPSSITYKPPPLRFQLDPVSLDLPILTAMPISSVEATVFDFAAVSVALHAPFHATAADLTTLAGRLATPATGLALVQAARRALQPLHERLRPAIQKPFWHDDLWEEYFVFQFPPATPAEPAVLLKERAAWLASLLRLEDQPLSEEEITEAMRLPLRYGRDDLFLPDWAAAVLLDDEQGAIETLQTIEFANLQLLEYRHIDDRLDVILARADQLIHRIARSRLPFWRRHDAPLRVLGELKVEANGLFERTGNVFKLIGDQYLARLYRLLAMRFHLSEWERIIQRKLEVIEGVYRAVSDQTASFRTEFLELIVIVLILLEVLVAVFRH